LALQEASRNGHKVIVETLISAGVDLKQYVSILTIWLLKFIKRYGMPFTITDEFGH